jgi:hypothetical protein
MSAGVTTPSDRAGSSIVALDGRERLGIPQVVETSSH